MITFLIILLLVVAGSATFVLYYSSSYHKRRAKILEKVPVSPVGDIEEEGVTKVVGKVVALDTAIPSPMSKTKCVFYHLLIEQQKAREEAESTYARRRTTREDDDDDDDDVTWEPYIDESKAVAFAVEDETGMAAVEPKNLDVEVKSNRRVDSGYLKQLSETQEKALVQRYPDKKFSFTRRMRYREVTIEEGDKLVVTGEVDLPKDDHPRFKALDDHPIHVSDKTENEAAADSLSKAKSHLIFTCVTAACTLGLTVWLIVHLATAKKSSGSSGGSESASNNNNSGGKDGVLPPRDNQFKDGFERPPNDGGKFENPPKDNLPRGNDVDSILTRYKAKAGNNDVFGAADELRALGSYLARVDDKKRTQIFNTLMGYANVENVFIKGDAWQNALRWAGKADIPALAKALKDEIDGNRQGQAIHRLGELKDAAGAGVVAPFLADDRLRGEAINALKAMGPAAEKPVLIFLKPENEPRTRTAALEVLEQIGGKESAPFVDAAVADADREVSNWAKRAIGKIVMRSGYERSIESLLNNLTAKIAANDGGGAREAIADIGRSYKFDHPKKVQIATTLIEASKTTNDQGIRNEAVKEACRWAGDDVGVLAGWLKDGKDTGIEQVIVEKLRTLKPDNPKGGEVFTVLQDISKTGQNVFFRGDAAKEACRWAGKTEVPKMAEWLVECKDGGVESIILARFKELKDPRCADTVARFIGTFKKDEAKAVFRVLGPAGEKALHPYAMEKGPDGQNIVWFNRTPVLELLGEIGTKDSVPLLNQLSNDPNKFVRDAATAALSKVKARKN
jgi:HEAT repeat protein